MPALLGALVAAATASSPSLSCFNVTATTLTLRWARVDATDLYSVSLASSPTSRPAALQTTVETTLAFDDLYPDTDYWLTLRSHPSIEPVAEVWGWRPAAAVLHCRTSTENTAAPHRLRRQGDTPHESELRLEWATAAAGVPRAEAAAGVPRGGTPIAAHSVGIRTQGGLSPWRWAAATAPSTAVLSGLPSGTAWEVTVRDDTTGAVSDPLIMRTAAPGAMHTTAWRISEYTFDVDFLQNHDAAEAKTLPLYIQYDGAVNESCYSGFAPGAAHCNGKGPACIDKLSTLCGAERASGWPCMRCADAHRAELLSACGNFSDADDVQDTGRWAEHWFCGAGWPGSTFQRSPMTSYCVEHASAPQTDPTPGGDGYAQYVSCNSDECEVTNNSTPRAPVCICWVHDDRENSYQPESEISKACNPKDDPAGFLGCAGVDDKFCKTAPQCNCTMGAPGHEATALPLSSAMASHVGRSDVFLPMSGAREPLLIGGFLSFPKLGACTETEALGESGCKWKRLPRSRMLYGADLVIAGYNTSQAFQDMDEGEEIAFGLRNIAAFGRAVAALDQIVQPRCCGC